MPQISVIGGPCAGGAAYSPALGDLTVMAGHDAKMFLTGPAVVERVTREQVTALELGGPKVHGRNGVAHLFAEHDVHAAELVRAALAHLPSKAGGGLPLYPPADPAPGDPGEVLPAREREVYDVRDVAARLVDDGELLEFGPRWARNLVVGFARISGAPVGIIANQPKHLGGCLDAESSQKGAWFVDLCDRFGLPLVVLVDTPGFLPGVSQEQAGVIRHGASLLRAFSVATDAAHHGDPAGGLRRRAHRHELARPRRRPDHGLAACEDRRHGRRVRPSRSSTAARSRPAPTPTRCPTRTPPSTCRCGWPRRAASSTRSSRRARRASASPSRWRPLGDASGGRRGRAARSQTRNATEEAILDAARAALAEKGFEALTMDAIARKAFVVAHGRLLLLPQQARGRRPPHPAGVQRDVPRGEPVPGRRRRPAPRAARRRWPAWSTWSTPTRGLLLLAAQLSGARGEHLPEEWEPYILRFVERAEARIARDQEHGIAPDDIAPRLSAQALLAMVENHITRELVLKRGDANESIRTLAELWWRAVYSRPGAAAPA